MDATDPLPDDDYEREDRDVLASLEGDTPQSGLGPDPGDLDEIAPGVAPQVSTEPAVEGPVDIGNYSTGTPPAGAPAPLPGAAATPDAEAVARRQTEQDMKRAEVEAATAQRQALAAQEADEDERLAQADYLERRQAAEQDFAAKAKAYEQAKLVDPRTKGNGLRAKLSVIFGGLGAAYRSAGGGDSRNYQLERLQKEWAQDTEIQKANIAALRDQTVMARTRIGDVDEGRAHMRRDADARLAGKLGAVLKQGEAKLREQGATQVQIDGDKRILSLRAQQAAALKQAAKDADAHALNQARINALNAKAERDKRRKAAGAGGDGVGGGKAEQVAQYLIENPGDIPGAMRVAGPGFDSKRFDKIVNQTKGTEGQNKNAQQAKIGLDAIDAIEKSGYKPTRDEIQKWINNQRLTAGAAERSIGGAALTVGQWFKLVPQSEVEGLSPQAQQYFANVRRYVEPIARSQSGAAISASEWENFFNQYGPNSQGGLEAAKQYLANTGRVAGVAGRQLGSGKPAAPAGGGNQDAEAVSWAKAHLSDPRARAILKANGL